MSVQQFAFTKKLFLLTTVSASIYALVVPNDEEVLDVPLNSMPTTMEAAKTAFNIANRWRIYSEV